VSLVSAVVTSGYVSSFEPAMRLALDQAAGARTSGDVPVVTLEPCTMCAGAVTAARLGRVVYGAADPRAGAAGSLWDVLRDRRLSPHIEVIGGVLEDECANLLREFFEHLRDT